MNKAIRMTRTCHYCGEHLTMRDDIKTFVCPVCGAEYTFRKRTDGAEVVTVKKQPAVDVLHVAQRIDVRVFDSLHSVEGINEDIKEHIARVMAHEIMKRMSATVTPMVEQDLVEIKASVRLVRSEYEFE